MKRIILFLVFFSRVICYSQTSFSEVDLVNVVRKYHPVAKQTEIGINMAGARITAAKGAFDPAIRSEVARKEFGGLTYYDQTSHELKIPVWYGMDLYAGQETIEGSRVNPEDTKGTLSYFGFSIPVMQQLLMDKRRATLLQARNFYSLSIAEQKIVMNDLLKEALEAYWTWWQHHEIYTLVQNARSNAEQRLKLIKIAIALGDRPAIDSVEALTQVQQLELKLGEAFVVREKSRFFLSAFLWSERGQYELPSTVFPQAPPSASSQALSEYVAAAGKHPILIKYKYVLDNLEIEKKLKFQSLLPELRFKYQQTATSFGKTFDSPWFDANYRFGLSFSVPLRLSQGRGEFAEARLKLDYNRLEAAGKNVEIITNVKQHFVEMAQMENQLSVQKRLLENTIVLQKGEETRFSNGESSLFVVNSRELKTIEAKEKMISLQAKARMAMINLQWSAGLFAE